MTAEDKFFTDDGVPLGTGEGEIHFIGTVAWCSLCHMLIKMWYEPYIEVINVYENDIELSNKIYHSDCYVHGVLLDA